MDIKQAVRIGLGQAVHQRGFINVGNVFAVKAKTEPLGFQRAQPFLKRFLEGAADGHGFANRLHCRTQHRLAATEFFEIKPWQFDNTVVDGRLKTGRRHFCDVVFEFIQCIADSQLGSKFRDRKARGFGRQGRAA